MKRLTSDQDTPYAKTVNIASALLADDSVAYPLGENFMLVSPRIQAHINFSEPTCKNGQKGYCPVSCWRREFEINHMRKQESSDDKCVDDPKDYPLRKRAF